MIKKYIGLFLILVLALFSLSGCFTSKNVDDLAYIVAVGLDVGETSLLKVSFQLAIIQGSTSGSSNSSQSNNTTTISVESDSIYGAVSLLDSYLSKKSNFLHCKAIVISEELAAKGISKYIYTAINDIEIKTNINIIICQNNSEYFLKSSQPLLEQFSAKYYDSIKNSNDYTGFTENVQLKNFFLDLSYKFSAPYAILGSVKQDKKHNVNSNLNYNVGDTPININNNIETVRIGYF